MHWISLLIGMVITMASSAGGAPPEPTTVTLFVHAGWEQTYPDESYYWIPAALRAEGFEVVDYQVPLVSEAASPAQVNELLDEIDRLNQSYDRVIVAGMSLGGYYATMTGFVWNDRRFDGTSAPYATINLAGPLDPWRWSQLMESDQTRDAVLELGGGKVNGARNLRVVRYADPADQVVHHHIAFSTSDPIVPYWTQTWPLTLLERLVPVNFHDSSADHALRDVPVVDIVRELAS